MGLPNQLPSGFHTIVKGRDILPVVPTKTLELSSPLLFLSHPIFDLSANLPAVPSKYVQIPISSHCVCVSHSVVADSLQPHGLQPTRLLCPWDFTDKDTGVSCHFLLQGIFPTQGSNLGLLRCRQILYQLSYKGSPIVSWFSVTSLLSPGSRPVSSLNFYFPVFPYSPLLTRQPERFW